MNSVEKIDSNALREPGPEHHEHEDQPDVVGLPDRADRPVDQLARAPAAVAAAGDQAPEPGAEVRAAEHGVRGHADPEHRGDGVGAAHRAPSARPGDGGGPYGHVDSSSSASRQRRDIARSVSTSAAPSTAYSSSTSDERDPDAARLRDRVLGAHHVVDDPRLAADLGDDPAALERDHGRDARDGDGAQEPLASAGCRACATRRSPSQSPSAISAVQMPTIVSNAQCSIVLAGGRSSGGTVSSPVTCVSVLKPTRNESNPGMPMPPLTPSLVQRP